MSIPASRESQTRRSSHNNNDADMDTLATGLGGEVTDQVIA